MHESNHYTTLGVRQEATPREIKQAYRNLAKLNHPDRHEGNEVRSSHFHRIQQAYETLNDPARRTKYDRLLVLNRDTDGPSGNTRQMTGDEAGYDPTSPSGHHSTGGVYNHEDIGAGNLYGIRTSHVLFFCVLLWVLLYLGWRHFTQGEGGPISGRPATEDVSEPGPAP
jgi:curved DNA-binding protein CbpA